MPQRYIVIPTAKRPDVLRLGKHDDRFRGLEFSELVEQEIPDSEIARARRDPSQEVVHSMPMKLHEPIARAAAPAEPAGPVAWGVRTVRAHESAQTGRGVPVAVLDTGIDAEHQAFNGVDLVQNDFTGEGNGDFDGHGTHCAGTLFGRPIDGLRFGVAPGIERAYIAKVIGAAGATTGAIARGITWAVNCGAKIISMSLGIDFPGFVAELAEDGFPLDVATSKALEAYRENLGMFSVLAAYAGSTPTRGGGSLIVAAGGNESRRDVDPRYQIAVSPPAASEHVISTGALGIDNDLLYVAPFSNTNVDVVAPGVDVISARPGGGHCTMSGTSMAAPHLAGLAALWAERLSHEHGRSVRLASLVARVVGSGVRSSLEATVAHADIGTGLVQAPVG